MSDRHISTVLVLDAGREAVRVAAEFYGGHAADFDRDAVDAAYRAALAAALNSLAGTTSVQVWQCGDIVAAVSENDRIAEVLDGYGDRMRGLTAIAEGIDVAAIAAAHDRSCR